MRGPPCCAWTAAPGFTTTIRPRRLARAGQRCRWRSARVDIRWTCAWAATADASTWALLLAPASSEKVVDPESWPDRSSLEEAIFELAAVLSAHMAGDVEQELVHAAALAKRPGFSLGLSAAARVAEVDSTRPENMNRDRARALYLQAVKVDPHLARAWLDLARLELDNDRPREAVQDAQQAQSAAPDWWLSALQLADALRARGLERDADAALAVALAHGQQGQGVCAVLESGFRRAEERALVGEQERLASLLLRCDAQSELPVLWYRQRGDLTAAEAALRRALPTSADPAQIRSELAGLLLARGDAAGAASELQALVDWSPRDVHLRLRLADALLATGAAKGRAPGWLRRWSVSPEAGAVRQAARMAGLSLPLDEFRLDGAQVIRDFLASGHRYQAPAVVVLDRTVERIFPDGGRASLTHTITLVLSKEGIERAGEVSLPSGAEVLGCAPARLTAPSARRKRSPASLRFPPPMWRWATSSSGRPWNTSSRPRRSRPDSWVSVSTSSPPKRRLIAASTCWWYRAECRWSRIGGPGRPSPRQALVPRALGL
jgi:hypothetical protein